MKFKIENRSPILSFELEFRSLLYPLLILFVGRSKVSTCNYKTSYLGINFMIYKNLRNRSRWMAVLVSRPFALWALRTNLQTFYSPFVYNNGVPNKNLTVMKTILMHTLWQLPDWQEISYKRAWRNFILGDDLCDRQLTDLILKIYL